MKWKTWQVLALTPDGKKTHGTKLWCHVVFGAQFKTELTHVQNWPGPLPKLTRATPRNLGGPPSKLTDNFNTWHGRRYNQHTMTSPVCSVSISVLHDTFTFNEHKDKVPLFSLQGIVQHAIAESLLLVCFFSKKTRTFAVSARGWTKLCPVNCCTTTVNYVVYTLFGQIFAQNVCCCHS